MKKEINIVNHEAYKKYNVGKEYMMGVCLTPNDIRGFKSGKVDISRAWCTIQHKELFIVNMRIRGAATKNAEGKMVEPQRKLLEHREVLNNLISEVYKNKLCIVPLKVTANEDGLMKITVALCTKNPDYVPSERPAFKGNGARKGKSYGAGNRAGGKSYGAGKGTYRKGKTYGAGKTSYHKQG